MRIFAAVVGVWCALSPSWSVRADDVPSRVEAMLSEGVETSVPVEAYRALGRPGMLALIATFERIDAPRHVRLRALSALSVFRDDEEAARFLRKLVRAATSPDGSWGELHPARSPTVMRRAIVALSEVAARPSADDFAPSLAHADVEVRKAAASALGRIDSLAAKQALSARLRVEPSPLVKAALTDALTGRFARPVGPRPADRGNGSPPQ